MCTAALFALAVLLVPAIALAQAQAPDAVVRRALRDGAVPVLVEVRDSGTAATVGGRQVTPVDRRERALARLSGETQRRARRFAIVHAFSARVTPDELTALESSPDVAAIEMDEVRHLVLNESVPLIGAPSVVAAGFGGSGWAVAILDTGIDETHPFLAGRVVSEACYSTTYGSYSSLCPGGAASSLASGAGLNCAISLTQDCFHGTHVAGIAAGRTTGLVGVAPDASIITIKVFSYDSSAGDLAAFDSDVLAGLDRVYALRGSFNIAAVNLSLGGRLFTSACDSTYPLYKSAIDRLRAVGIATVIASGNAGAVDSISAPACISSAVSVGATSKSDVVAAFSDSSAQLSLLAPGVGIMSSYPGGGWATASGTSMAAPHVTGTWALLKQKKPSASVDELLAALQSTGVPITDSRNGLVRSRIQVDAAYQRLLAPPAVPVPIAPFGSIVTPTPTFTWQRVDSATWYQLWVEDAAANRIINWYTPAQAGCTTAATCAVALSTPLAPGTGHFWVLASNDTGNSGYSSRVDFTITVPSAEAATVESLYPVASAITGGPARLWAYVKNTGGATLPGSSRAWFNVDGPSWTGDHWVGAADVSGLAPNAAIWVSFDWPIPSSAPPGGYSYTAAVYDGGRISGASPTQPFAVSGPSSPAAAVVGLYPVNGGSVARQSTAALWAYVENTGTVAWTAGTVTWFYVDGPGWTGSHWVGGTATAALQPGQKVWVQVLVDRPCGRGRRLLHLSCAGVERRGDLAAQRRPAVHDPALTGRTCKCLIVQGFSRTLKRPSGPPVRRFYSTRNGVVR